MKYRSASKIAMQIFFMKFTEEDNLIIKVSLLVRNVLCARIQQFIELLLFIPTGQPRQS